MKVRAQWLRTVAPHSVFMLVNERDKDKVGRFFEQRFDQSNDCMLVLDTTRSDPEHAHYFACVQTAFDNLPEDMAKDFRSSEHLRKWGLVKSGFCTITTWVCRSMAEARRLKRAIVDYDDYAVITIERRIVTAYKPQSQSYESMSASEFRRSKGMVLDVLSNLIGTSVEELLRSNPRGKTKPERTDHRAGLHDQSDADLPQRPGVQARDEAGGE